MTNKTLSILALLATILVVVTVYEFSRERTVEIEFQSGQLLVPEIDASRIDAIKVQKGDSVVELARVDRNSFRIKSLDSYPASNREVNSIITGVSEIRCTAEASSNPAQHAALNVDEGGANSTTVSFLDQDGKVIAGVIIGEDVDGARYGRRIGDDQAYRLESAPYLRTTALDFADKRLIELQRDQLASVEVAPKDGRAYTIKPGENGDPQLQDVPDGFKAKQYEPGSVAGAVSYLSFTDLKPEAALEGVEFGSTFTAESKSGARYVLQIGQDAENKYWLRVRAQYVGPARVTPTPGLEGEEADKELEQLNKYKEASDACQAFQARHQGWVYQVAEWTAKNLTKPFDDLVEPDDGRPDEVAASHILIPFAGAERAAEDVTRTKEEAQALAQSLLEQALDDPSRFEDLARENSSCPSAEKGGDLGTFKFDAMAKPFSEAAFALDVDQICDHVVETQFGFHVIKRTK
ncbi:MAG: peptidylprolyl isomerase [Planctomycetes bacterium]|nr:peptidylprolyl isomerase [Planctomycetota bacterium]